MKPLIPELHTAILRKAIISDIPDIWEILQQAIEQRKLDGSTQWQNGYPNEQTILDDLHKGYAFVYDLNEKILAYVAIVFDEDPNYFEIEGNWLSHGAYVNLHRIATSKAIKNQGIASRLLVDIEHFTIQKNVFSIKIDTNFDNVPMLRILEKLGYSYCGEVMVSGSPRKAFEKILEKS